MKRIFVYGAAVLALSAAPALAQSSQTQGTQQPGSATDQSGSRPGSTQGSQGGEQTGSRSGARTGSQSDTNRNASTADQRFMMDVARGSLAEIELGKLASEKASDPKVKEFGQKMVQDHTKASDELKTLAQGKNITLPADLDAKHKATHDRLAKLSGQGFDRAYAREMVTGHQRMLTMFRRESQSGKDPEVKAWAAKMVPSVQEHLTMAQGLNRGAVGTSGRRSGTSGTAGSTGTQGVGAGSGNRDRSGSGNTGSGGSANPGSGGSHAPGSGGSNTPGGAGANPNNPR
jgi:putative membrane protein